MKSVKICIFDAYGTLFDVHSAVMRNAEELGECSEALSALWRQRQLEYSWTRTLMCRYTDFWEITGYSLDFALKTYKLERVEGLKGRLMNAYRELSAYPDAAETLRALKAMDLQTAILSNETASMLDAALKASNLSILLDACLSVDSLKIYKPDPEVYQLACDRFLVRPDEICFISSNAWDVGGAASFRFNAVRINRQGAPLEYEFAPSSDQLQSLHELPALLLRSNSI
ncbi:2-haloacid dehalogenase [Paraburkholderia sp. BL6665CI2N2]|uniref:haloacid dehalogenase type II n=1 Tax=Paraburkholderia sp. BL6665CI2N2 TaxID=1938806 RepID=UPI0010DD19AF|nr:haloacid dehalogenase type II [Paraburkholderia sp. BL6665CI2N2]TDY21985.1 2-haloacid dehalogenase [Paraburkholderia sp. BL6665CI2N2]